MSSNQTSKKKPKIEIQDTYDGEGYWIKRSVNGFPVFVPKQHAPSVQIITPDTEYVTEKFYMSKKEFEEKYPKMAPESALATAHVCKNEIHLHENGAGYAINCYCKL